VKRTPEAYPLGHVEDGLEPRTKLGKGRVSARLGVKVVFFNILPASTSPVDGIAVWTQQKRDVVVLPGVADRKDHNDFRIHTREVVRSEIGCDVVGQPIRPRLKAKGIRGEISHATIGIGLPFGQ
jgi:hypothetical protein